MSELNLSEIIRVPFTNYFNEEQTKKQIVLHHTAGGTAQSSISWWSNKTDKVATCVVIDRDGRIYQCFPSKCWAYSLGIQMKVINSLNITNYTPGILDKHAIAIEIANYGGLTRSGDKWHTAYNTKIAEDKVFEIPEGFRGYTAFDKYTNEQIESVRKLIVYWCGKYGISKKYDPAIFDVNINALSGTNGIYCHASYRKDKSDIFPQTEMIQMLQSL